MNLKQKTALAAAIVEHMAKRGVDVAVVDSILDPETLAVFKSDGGLLSKEDGGSLAVFMRNWRLFGPVIR